ncbi:hypothetical protein G7Y89_g14690 [Cudoniella acicularis]|uniref:Kinesin light chain n=1 Tax=Cudoniella acicularis TaxID=354080 RepID=A0A8H4VTW0_9HELO|nr:hypothetical protein G7Y89_g14690 [Cudoniella acicularis]
MANLASTFWNQGRWDTAEELEAQVMETRKKKLGADHPDTLTRPAIYLRLQQNREVPYPTKHSWESPTDFDTPPRSRVPNTAI